MEELDLTKSNWIFENEIYLIAIKESLAENYPDIDIIKELNELDFSFEDLLDVVKSKHFMEMLDEKYKSKN